MKISFFFLLSLTMISCSTNQLQEADFYNVISASVPIEGGEIVFSDSALTKLARLLPLPLWQRLIINFLIWKVL